jgi:hypothetical protein
MLTEQFVLLKRLLIIFGSICFVWFIIGFIFLSIQTYRHFKKRTNQKFYLYSRSFLLSPSSLKQESVSDDDDDDGQTSVSTSVSFISERSKTIHEHTHYSTSCQGIPEKPLELIFPNRIGLANLGYSRSTLSSSSDNDTSLLYYPGYRNYAYSQSTLCSSDTSCHEKTPTPSLNIPLSDFSSAIRQLSPSSGNTTSSQITNATYLSSQSSIKSNQLPTIMITDVDRLQTDIIELENFEPEKEFHRPRSQLRFYLNDRLPQVTE